MTDTITMLDTPPSPSPSLPIARYRYTGIASLQIWKKNWAPVFDLDPPDPESESKDIRIVSEGHG
jgi:hypothetical protein